MPFRLFVTLANNAYQGRLKDQSAAGGYGTHIPISVGQLGRYYQGPLFAHTHIQQSLIPTLDNLSFAKVKGKWYVAIKRRVEFRACGLEGAAVVYEDLVAGLGAAGAGEGLGVFDCEARVCVGGEVGEVG